MSIVGITNLRKQVTQDFTNVKNIELIVVDESAADNNISSNVDGNSTG